MVASSDASAVVDLLQTIRRIEGHLHEILHLPRCPRDRFGDIRRVTSDRFAIAVLQILDSEVVVIACLHSSRSPRAHARVIAGRRL